MTAPARSRSAPSAAERRHSLIDPRSLVRIKNLQLRARAAVEGFIKGIHRSPYHGFSVEFSEYRQYTPGDDPRYLDWRLFARTDRYYVKRFEDETNLRCHLVLDTSRSMSYRSGDYSKSEYARTAAATIAYFLTLQRDAVGLITFEDRITDYLPPRHRPGHLRRILAMLDREPQGRATDLAGPLEEIAATVKKRGLIVLISDLLAPADALRSRLGYLRSRGHEVILLRVLDPAEVGFTFAAPAMFHDVESGRELYIDPDAARAGYLARFAQHAAEVKQACTDLMIEFQTITTDSPLELMLFDLLKARLRRAGKPGPAPRPPRGGGVPGELPDAALHPGRAGGGGPDRVPPDPPHHQGRGPVQLPHLPLPVAAPPTRRSRLDHWFLLLLRAAALILLAVAFARPFFREAAGLTFGDVEQRRVALLVDTSASMRRGDLWEKAKARAIETIEACRPDDQLAVLAFDGASRTLLGFEESATLDPSRRQAVAKTLVGRLAPGWGATHLDQALMDAAGAIENVGDAGHRSSRVRRRIVLISDLQQGSRLDTLGDFEWPSDLELDLKTVATEGSNAGLQWLAGPDVGESPAAEGANDLRVRVANEATSNTEAFSLAWTDDKAPPISAYVPPGESRVVRVPRPAGATPGRSLRLKGDLQEFDNILYLASEVKESATVLYLGSDSPDDPSGLSYYLKRVFQDTPRRTVKFESRSSSTPLAFEPGHPVPLIVLAAETSAGNIAPLRQFVQDGGTVLAVVTAPGKVPTLSALAGSPTVDVEDPAGRGDAMLTEIAFDHPIFAQFAAPQFNDFTKIKFWNHRRIPTAPLGNVRVLARFEKGDPALIEKVMGKGRLVIMASGWSPADSQLARSSKFMPLMSSLLDGPLDGPDLSANRLVQERVPLPEGSVAVRKPDGSQASLETGASTFSQTDTPGVYAVETAKGPREFAVNLDPSESRTAPLDVETLEKYGCRLTRSALRIEDEREAMRQLQNAELEGRQKLWRPLLLAAISVVIVETWLAGWLGRPRPNRAEAKES